MLACGYIILCPFAITSDLLGIFQNPTMHSCGAIQGKFLEVEFPRVVPQAGAPPTSRPRRRLPLTQGSAAAWGLVWRDWGGRRQELGTPASPLCSDTSRHLPPRAAGLSDAVSSAATKYFKDRKR